MKKIWKATGLLGLVGFAALAYAQVIPVPQVSVIGPNDLFQDVVNGAPQASNVYASGAMLAGFVGNGAPGTNMLIGGKADQNLWQRATTGSSVTTTITYGSADRWAYWSGTNTAMTLSKVTTAAALPVGSVNVFRLQRTASQTGVVQVCMAQEITAANTYPLQGHTVLLDFNVYTGANFSATAMTAYISTGTTADEGVSKLAFSLNAGGGGSAATGFANATAAVIPLAAVSTAYRVAAVANIPTTAAETFISLCWTPVGTAGTTDALYFDNIELRKADGLASFANAAAGYVLGGTGANSIVATINSVPQNAQVPSFSFRTYEDEQKLQLAYYYAILESGTSGAQQSAAGNGATTTTCQLYFPFPVNMRVAPTFAALAAFSTSTFTITHIATATALGTPYLAVLGANTVNGGSVTATVASGLTTGQTCVLTSAAGSGSFGWSAEL